MEACVLVTRLNIDHSLLAYILVSRKHDFCALKPCCMKQFKLLYKNPNIQRGSYFLMVYVAKLGLPNFAALICKCTCSTNLFFSRIYLQAQASVHPIIVLFGIIIGNLWRTHTLNW